MQLAASRGQQTRDLMHDASGTIANGTTSQLLLPEAKSRSFLFIVNASASETLYLEFGAARATATITNGVVTSVTITNGGFGYTYPPDVYFDGGGNSGVGGVLGVGLTGYPAPGDPAWSAAVGPSRLDMSTQRIAKGRAVLTNGVVTSIVVDDGGSGYQAAPYVRMTNSPRDPFGCADPGAKSASGFWGTLPLTSGQSFYINGTSCPTDPIAAYAVTTGHAFTIKYMP